MQYQYTILIIYCLKQFRELLLLYGGQHNLVVYFYICINYNIKFQRQMLNNQQLQTYLINKVDMVLKSFKDLLRVKINIEKVFQKEEKNFDFCEDVCTAQKLLKQNEQAKLLYQNHLNQVLDLYDQYQYLSIWPRLFTRLNETLVQMKLKVGDSGYIREYHFQNKELLYEIFEELENQNLEKLKILHRKIYFLELDVNKQDIQKSKKQSIAKIRPSSLFRKSKLNSLNVTIKQAKENLTFLEAAKILQKHITIIPQKQNTIETLQYCQFSFLKNLVINVDKLMKNMLERNKRIDGTIKSYSKQYYHKKQQSMQQNKNSTKVFTENIRNIKNKIQGESCRTSIAVKTPKKASIFLYNLNLQLLLEETGEVKKNKLDGAAQLISQINSSFSEDYACKPKSKFNSNRQSQTRPNSQHKKNKEFLKNQKERLKKTAINFNKRKQKKFQNCVITKTKKYIFDDEQQNNKNMSSSIMPNQISFYSKVLNLAKSKKHIKAIAEKQKINAPIFIMVKNKINIHSFSTEAFKKKSPFMSFQEFTSCKKSDCWNWN